MADAIRVIQREHTALIGVVDALKRLTEDMASGDFSDREGLLDAIVDYIESFSERFHHPKEDQYLFKALDLRCPEARQVLDELRAEHRKGGELIAALRRALAAYHADPTACDALAEAAQTFAQFQYQHLLREEREVLPLTRKMLTDEDWAEIDAAFANNEDPLFGDEPKARFRDLYAHIVSLAPPPFGLGEQGAALPEKPSFHDRLAAMLRKGTG